MKKKREAPWNARVKALVRALGSHEAVAAELGVCYASVVRWCKGARPSRIAQAQIVEVEKKRELQRIEGTLGEVKP